MDHINLTSQTGMETALRDFCTYRIKAQHGRINGLCSPEFVSCSFGSKTLCLSFPVQDWMLNPADNIHGGILTTAFDITMGLLSCYCSGWVLTPTTNMQVTFLRPIPAGETLIIKASCDMSGKTMCAVSGQAWLQSNPDKLTATASATFYCGPGAQKISSIRL